MGTVLFSVVLVQNRGHSLVLCCVHVVFGVLFVRGHAYSQVCIVCKLSVYLKYNIVMSAGYVC